MHTYIYIYTHPSINFAHAVNSQSSTETRASRGHSSIGVLGDLLQEIQFQSKALRRLHEDCPKVVETRVCPLTSPLGKNRLAQESFDQVAGLG